MPGQEEKVEYSNVALASARQVARLRAMAERDWVSRAASLAERFAERAPDTTAKARSRTRTSPSCGRPDS